MLNLKKLVTRIFLLAPILALGIVLAPFTASAKTQSLFQCYQSLGRPFPSLQERAIDAAKYGIWQYRGTAAQNEELSSYLCPGNAGDLGFSVVTDFQKTLSAQMTATQDFISVSSLVLRDGTTLTMADLGVRVFLTLEPGATKEEIAVCTGINGTLVRFTGCTRGLAFKGTDLSAVTANQKTHAAGSTVVISNVHYVYDQFLDRTGRDQDIAGIKTFTSSTLQIGDDTTSTFKYIKFPVGQGTEPYIKVIGPGAGSSSSTFYFSADGVSDFQLNASGTTFAVSSTRGIFITDGLIGVNASSSKGMDFDSNGFLYINASSTGGVTFDSTGKIKINTAQALTWTATSTFAIPPIDSAGAYVGTPPGVINPYVTSTAPTGWFSCNGAAVSRTTYASLFSIIGTTYGSGDGVSTFNIPDLRGKTTFMASSTVPGFTTYGFSSGSSTHIMTEAELAAHTHTYLVGSAGGGTNVGPNTSVGAGGTTGSTGSSAPMDIMNPYMVMNYIIKY